MSNTPIAVIGGGPAGMMAAITAAAMGAPVILLEKMDKPGKKLLVTGRGRCNLSNTDMDASHYHSGKKNFVRDVLGQFGLAETLAFFEEMGIPTKTEKEGKVIPWSEQSSAVLDVLMMEMKDLGVEIRTASPVKKINVHPEGYLLDIPGQNSVLARAVILATGGKSYPNLGSSGDGYTLARSLGHSVVEPFPALVHIKCAAPYLKSIDGNKFMGNASLELDNRIVKTYYGEILFTDYGLSGIPLLQLSRRVTQALAGRQVVRILLDLFPETDSDTLYKILHTRIQSRPERSIQDSLTGLLHTRLIPVVLKENGIQDKDQPCAQVKEKTIQELARWLKAWPIVPTGTREWDVAQVTAGGIDVREVDSLSLESRIQKGFFLAGEVLDVDGECGGYNLQWAWSSGFTAGRHAAQYVEEHS